MENQEKDSTAHPLEFIPYEKFVPMLKNASWQSRDDVITFLNPFSEGRAFEFITKALQDREVLVRSKALEAIDLSYISLYLYPVITARNDEDNDIRERSNRILTNHPPDKTSYEDFVAAVNFFATKTYFEKRNIRDFLNSLGNKAFELISKALKDPDVDVRSNVLWGLFYIYTPQYFDLVIAAMTDEKSNIRSLAITFFPEKKIVNDKIIESLINALRDEDDHIRNRAARTLGKYKDAQAVEPLLSLLKDKMVM